MRFSHLFSTSVYASLLGISNAGITKKGRRTIAPKRASVKKTAQAQKAGSAQLAARTEKRLAERAGHLELLAGGKKDKKAEK